jgi:hypothetical protein
MAAQAQLQRRSGAATALGRHRLVGAVLLAETLVKFNLMRLDHLAALPI